MKLRNLLYTIEDFYYEYEYRILGIMFIILGILMTCIEKDATVLFMSLCMGIPAIIIKNDDEL